MNRFSIPIISFLHVPGKMSQPLWLMMGTAFRVDVPVNRTAQLFLTAKHTFVPWDYVKDASTMKIPVDYRKLRYVIARAYGVTGDGMADAARVSPMRLVATHPTLDVAVLRVDTPGVGGTTPVLAPDNALEQTAHMPAVTLKAAPLQSGCAGRIEGFRGVGMLGELDTFDPSLLDKLPPEEKAVLLKDLQNVEGKQVAASVDVQILDGRGMCHASHDGEACFHGMSGGPVLIPNGDGVECAGILYGKHPDSPSSIGYTPTNEILDWFTEVAQRANRPKT